MKCLKCMCGAVALLIASAPTSSSRTIEPLDYSYISTGNGEYVEAYQDHLSNVYHQIPEVTPSTRKSLHPSILAHHYYDPPALSTDPTSILESTTKFPKLPHENQDYTVKVSPSHNNNNYLAKVSYSQSPKSVSYITTQYSDLPSSTEGLIRKTVIRRKARPLRPTDLIPVKENTTEYGSVTTSTLSKGSNITIHNVDKDSQKDFHNRNPENRQKISQTKKFSSVTGRRQKVDDQTSQKPTTFQVTTPTNYIIKKDDNTRKLIRMTTERVKPSGINQVNSTAPPQRLNQDRQRFFGNSVTTQQLPISTEVIKLTSIRPLTINPIVISTTNPTTSAKIIWFPHKNRTQTKKQELRSTTEELWTTTSTPSQYLLKKPKQKYIPQEKNFKYIPEESNQTYLSEEPHQKHSPEELNQSYDKKTVNFISQSSVATDQPNADDIGIDVEEEFELDNVDPEDEYPEEYWVYDSGDETTTIKPPQKQAEMIDLRQSASDGHEQQEDDQNEDEKKEQSGVEGEGEKEKSVRHNKSGKKAEKGYESKELYDKAKKGQSDKKDHINHHQEEGGKKKKHHEESGHAKGHRLESEGKKAAEFNEVGKHKKGHSTKGSHNVHKKNEYLKKHEFYDEHHEDDAHQKYGDIDVGHKHKHGGYFNKLHNDKDFSEGHKGKNGKKNKGYYVHDDLHHEKNLNEKKHHGEKENFHKNHGTNEGKRWKYEKGNANDLDEESED